MISINQFEFLIDDRKLQKQNNLLSRGRWQKDQKWALAGFDGGAPGFLGGRSLQSLGAAIGSMRHLELRGAIEPAVPCAGTVIRSRDRGRFRKPPQETRCGLRFPAPAPWRGYHRSMNLHSVFRNALHDRECGATDVERRLIEALLESRATWSREALIHGASLLRDRSSMANLVNLAAKLREVPDLDEVEHLLLQRQEILRNLDQRFSDGGFDVVMAYSVVVTISRSSAVEAVLVGAFSRGWSGRIVVLDGTSSGCGPAQAERYDSAGLEVRSLPDGAMMEAIEEPSAQSLVLVGADAVGPRRIVNAQGTSLLLETASRRGIYTAVVADSGKDVGEDVITNLLEAGRIQRESGPARAWPVFEAFSRDLVRERLSEHVTQ